MEEAKSRRRPTAEEVITRLKDDGDFDTLRLQIINKVKENEELRKSIIMEVKQSQILNQDDSENLKPRQLSDAIYQEVGKKIMGHISDEVWKVIRSSNTKDDIRGTVESVYDRIVNPKPKEDNASKQKGASSTPATVHEASTCDEMPPGFASSNHELLLRLPAEEELHNPTNMVCDDDEMPPGFAVPVTNSGAVKVSSGINVLGSGVAATDLWSRFNTGGDVGVCMPLGFNTGGAGGVGARPSGVADEDDDLDVPPGFG